MEMSRTWQELGVVDTIYEGDHEEEEEEEDCSFNSPSMQSSSPATSASCSPAARSSLPPVLRNAVQAWSRANGSCKPDVIVRVQEHCFHLHRAPITSESGYLKRQLSESSDIAVDLPAGLTLDDFSGAVATCYGADADAALSPAGLAAAWAAAGWLELSAEDGLARRAEDYFFREVAADKGRAAQVLRSCAALLGGGCGEAAAALLVRCLETLAPASGGGGCHGGWLEDVAALPLEEFQVVMETMRARFAHDHDLVYTIVDHYLENHKGKLKEEDKSRLCYNVNCANLSHHLFMHLVQNPRLPLRFVVQAMLVEQLHSHHSMLLTHHHHPAAASTAPLLLKRSVSGHGTFSTALAAGAGDEAAAAGAGMSLGDILQRDAVMRQSAHIRASMQATGRRIDALERELAGLRGRLRRSEQQQQQQAVASAAIIDDRASAKSASFRIPRNRLWDGEDVTSSGAGIGIGAGAAKDSSVGAKAGGIRSRLLHGFKNLFGRKPPGVNGVAPPASSNGGTADVCVGEKGSSPEPGEEEYWSRPHRRNLSVV